VPDEIPPMTPPDCDLRGMPFMPLDIVRLLDSDLYALSTGDEFKAALSLWCRAFLQVPAGSLPDDERILAHLSGAGSRWTKVRGIALRGWAKASDGRLYHGVVAEKARDAWTARVAMRARTEAARAAKAARGNAVAAPATPSVTETVTASKRQGQGTGTGDRDRIEKESPQPPAEASPPRPAAPKASRLPTNWSPPPEAIDFAADLGLNPQRVAANFRDYWHAKSGKDATKLDWLATWRSWCRRDAERTSQSRSREQPYRNGFTAYAERIADDRGSSRDDENPFLIEDRSHER